MVFPTQESGGFAKPPDLAIGANSTLIKDYFLVPINGLKLDKTYQFQFQYEYMDGTLSAWSPAYALTSQTENVPAAPTNTVTGGAGLIKISLPTFPANALRVDVRIAGGTFGSGTVVVDSFTSAGVKTIAALGAASPGNAYVVTLLTVTPSKINGDPSSPVTVYVTDPAASIAVLPSETPSTPTVSQVLGAIQLSWNGKKADGSDQPAGFKAAKVYVGTSAGFTPVDTGNSGANQVDVLNFSNGQNTLNISVGTIVNAVALTYGTDYYVKIKTTNGNVAQDSSAVSATGNPVRIGQVGSGDIVSVTADKILAGTISSQTITVGTVGGKRVELRGSGNPLEIFGTGGTSLLSYSTGDAKLNITGDGSFTGNITGASGTIGGITLNSSGLSSTNFSITSTGLITAQSGTIGGWSITGSVLESPLVSNNRITLNPATPKIALLQSGVEKITIDPVEGIKDSAENFKLTPSGILTLKGSITTGSTITGSTINGSNINLNGVQTGSGSGASYTENSDTSTRLNFTDARYTIIPANDTWTESVSIPSYDYVNDEWTSTTTSSTYTSNTIKFTDSIFEGAVPGSAYYYGETWYEGGTSSGSIINYVNYLGGYLGFEIRANTTEKGFYFIGDSNISGQNWGLTHPTTAASGSKDQPAMLQTDASGKVTRGRAIFTTGSSSATILGNTWTSVGQNGDLAFSTNN